MSEDRRVTGAGHRFEHRLFRHRVDAAPGVGTVDPPQRKIEVSGQMSYNRVLAQRISAEFVVFLERYLDWLDRVDAAEIAAHARVRAAGGRVYSCERVGRDDGLLELVFRDVATGDLLGREIYDPDGRMLSSVHLHSADRDVRSVSAELPACDVPDPFGFTMWINTYLVDDIRTEFESILAKLSRR